MSNKEIDQAIRDKRLYFVGERLPADWYEAFRLWLPLAEAGDAKAQYNIGRCYSRGDGVDKDEALAMQWYLKAAAQNDPRAYFNIYLHYDELKDSTQAEDWLYKAARAGESRAIYALGEKTFNRGTEFLLLGDKDKARELFKQALDKGVETAQLGLIACDIEISFYHSTKTNYYSYTASVSGSNGNVSGGGTVTNSYDNPTIVFKAQNNSTQNAILTILIQKYDYANPDKKIGDEEALDFPELAPGECAEIVEELHGTDKEPIRVFYIAFTVWANRRYDGKGVFAYFEFPVSKLAWEWQEKKKKSGCFVLTACYGEHDAPTVLQYRQFRDNHLTKHVYGRKFISWYYTHGPKWADRIAQMPKTKAALRQLFRVFAHLLPR